MCANILTLSEQMSFIKKICVIRVEQVNMQ